MNVHRISLIAMLVSLSVATNYALIGVPNVKIMDFIVFMGGFCLGPLVGASIGIFTWAVYGAINPYGFIPQILLATMFSEAIYGLIGGLLGKNLVLSIITLIGRYFPITPSYGAIFVLNRVPLVKNERKINFLKLIITQTTSRPIECVEIYL